MTPLTDDQLRQVAAALVLEDARIAADDLVGISEQLGSVLADLGITIDGPPEDVPDETLSAIADLIAEATITVDWPDSPVRVVGNREPEEDA